MSLIVDEHRQYIADTARVSAFDEAVRDVVRPGDVVLDLGSGTGILGLLACRAGASRVYSIEEGGMIELARAICSANGYRDRVTFIKSHSTQVVLPEQVDVAVCDQMGRFGFEAGVSQYFDDVRKRLLKPGGRLIPARIDQFVVPVEFSRMWDNIEFWNGSPAGFNFAPARTLAANTGYPTKLSPQQFLGDSAKLSSLDVTRDTPAMVSGDVDVRINREGVMHGVGGWFTAQLSANATLTNSPFSRDAIDRRNVFFPLDRPVPVEPGDHVRIRMNIMPRQVMVSWNVEIHQAGTNGHATGGLKAKFVHSTLGGMLLTREDLTRTHPGFVPTLTSWGKARNSILELCDGVRSLSEIEQKFYTRHSDLFSSQADAAVFVAEVVTKYAR